MSRLNPNRSPEKSGDRFFLKEIFLNEHICRFCGRENEQTAPVGTPLPWPAGRCPDCEQLLSRLTVFLGHGLPALKHVAGLLLATLIGPVEKAEILLREVLNTDGKSLPDSVQDALTNLGPDVGSDLQNLRHLLEPAMPTSPLVVEEWVSEGHLGEDPPLTQADILYVCGRLLDKCSSTEILGSPLFKATNGRHYVINVEALIEEANPEYVEEVRESLAEDEEST